MFPGRLHRLNGNMVAPARELTPGLLDLDPDITTRYQLPAAPPALGVATGTHCADLTIQVAQVSGSSDIVDLVVLLTEANLPANFLDSTQGYQSDGGDIRFSTDANGETALAAEIVALSMTPSGSGATAEIHVRVPVVSAAADTVIRMWRSKKGGLSQPPLEHPFGRNAVWANYLLVWHGDTGADATGRRHTLTAYGSAAFGHTAAAKVGKAMHAPGASGAYFECAAAADILNFGARSLTMYVRPTAFVGSDYNKFFGNNAWEFGTQNLGANWHHVTPAFRDAWAASGASINTWHHIAATWDGVDDYAGMKTYVDGVELAHSAENDYGAPVSETAGIVLGRNHATKWYTGQHDEVRVAAGVWSADYIATDRNATNAPGSFVVAGSVTTYIPALLLAALLRQNESQFAALTMVASGGAPQALAQSARQHQAARAAPTLIAACAHAARQHARTLLTSVSLRAISSASRQVTTEKAAGVRVAAQASGSRQMSRSQASAIGALALTAKSAQAARAGAEVRKIAAAAARAAQRQTGVAPLLTQIISVLAIAMLARQSQAAIAPGVRVAAQQGRGVQRSHIGAAATAARAEAMRAEQNQQALGAAVSVRAAGAYAAQAQQSRVATAAVAALRAVGRQGQASRAAIIAFLQVLLRSVQAQGASATSRAIKAVLAYAAQASAARAESVDGVDLFKLLVTLIERDATADVLEREMAAELRAAISAVDVVEPDATLSIRDGARGAIIVA